MPGGTWGRPVRAPGGTEPGLKTRSVTVKGHRPVGPAPEHVHAGSCGGAGGTDACEDGGATAGGGAGDFGVCTFVGCPPSM